MNTILQKFIWSLPVTLLAGAQVYAQEQRPNLVYIFPDQYRLHALSLWSDPAYRDVLNTVGDPVHTPNLDRLAKQSVVFNRACSTCPLSSPHRAMLMTGAFPEKNGVPGNCHKDNRNGIPDSLICFTDVLADAGYETAYVGKTHWHRTEPLFDKENNYVGTSEAPGGHYVYPYDTYIPEGRGRKSNKYWFQQLKDNHFNATAYSNRPELVGGQKDGEAYHYRRFTTGVEADVAIEFLRNRKGQRDASKPFSLFLSVNPPHTPYHRLTDCKEEVFNQYYKDLKTEEVLLRPNVQVGEGTQVKNKERLTFEAKIYFSLIKSVDDEIGRVLKVLDEEGLADNTILVFAADHGEMMGSHGRMAKSVIYDESFSIPFFIRYPEKLKPGVNDLMLGATDIMPTLLGMMNLENKLPETVKGENYSQGILTGKYGKVKKPVSQFFYQQKEKGVRTDRYSYLVTKDGGYQLFDNLKDPYQMSPLQMEDIPAKQAKLLKKELGNWLKVSEDSWARDRKYPDRVIY